MRLAFTLFPRQLWAGGYNYQSNLFAALNQYRPGQFTPVLFAGKNDDDADFAAVSKIPGIEAVRSAAFDGRTGLMSALALGLDSAASAEFRANNIDVVFETARFFGWRLPFPTVAWFPDFQHLRLPMLFTAASRFRREIGFRVQIASGRMIMLSSASALKDFRAYYPRANNATSIVRFATRPPEASLSQALSDVFERYGVPEKYFFLPNQFWRHKNHQVVIDALTILASRKLHVVVCASGGTNDPRNPGHFEGVMQQVRDRGLEKSFVHLGMIPLPHVYALLRGTIALINPSTFEGWSTTVEEAKSFGVPIILSDIDVHREQAGAAARYFAIDDANALADHLWQSFQQSGATTARSLLPGLDDRMSTFAADFVDTAERAKVLFLQRKDRTGEKAG